MPILFIGIFYGLKEAGLYAVAMKLISIPISISQNSFGQVIHGNASERSSKSFTETINKVFLGLLLIGTIVSFFLISSAEKITLFFLGEQWTDASSIITILSLSLFIQLSTSPLTMLLNIYGLSNYSLYANAVLALCKAIGLSLGFFLTTFKSGLLVYVFFNCIGYLCFLIFVCVLTRLNKNFIITSAIIACIVNFVFFYFSRDLFIEF